MVARDGEIKGHRTGSRSKARKERVFDLLELSKRGEGDRGTERGLRSGALL